MTIIAVTLNKDGNFTMLANKLAGYAEAKKLHQSITMLHMLVGYQGVLPAAGEN